MEYKKPMTYVDAFNEIENFRRKLGVNMSRNFMVVHANPGDTPIIIFVDSITAIKDYGDGTCCVYTLDDKFYNVSESLADIMRKFNTGHCRIVND